MLAWSQVCVAKPDQMRALKRQLPTACRGVEHARRAIHELVFQFVAREWLLPAAYWREPPAVLGAIVLRVKIARGRIAAQLSNVPRCLIGKSKLARARLNGVVNNQRLRYPMRPRARSRRLNKSLRRGYCRTCVIPYL